jgi:hypothetical protein
LIFYFELPKLNRFFMGGSELSALIGTTNSTPQSGFEHLVTPIPSSFPQSGQIFIPKANSATLRDSF